MTVSGRLAISTALLILLLVAALAFHVTVVGRLADSNRALANEKVGLVVQTLGLQRLLETIDDSTRKLVVTGDPGYAAQGEERRRELDAGLRRIASGELAAAEREALARLESSWRELLAGLPEPEAVLAAATPNERARLLAPGLGRLSELRESSQRLVGAANDELARQGERSAAALRASQRLALGLFALALLSGIAAVVLAVRAIQRPLDRLIAATGRIAEQDFAAVVVPGNDEFSRLGAAFNQMSSRLAEVEVLKHNLLSHVSHELQTPLANLEEGHLLLLEGLAGPLTAEQRHHLELNVASCRRLARLISNLLERSRLDAGGVPLELAEHDLREIAAAVAEEFAARAAEARLLIANESPPEPLRVACDRERLAQVLRNLLDNALKFSASGGRVAVRLRRLSAVPAELPAARAALAERSAPWVLVEVADEGRGIPPSDRERIFERFYRSQQGRGGPPGVGLGLAICRDLVEAHGGAIWADAGLPTGSVFRVLLPAPQLARAARAPSAAPAEASS